ncbi:MAG TPA: MarR family transcriptional regulator [Acidimicrobiales bacterium]
MAEAEAEAAGGDQGDRVGAWRALLRAHSAVVRVIDADLAAAGLLPLHWYDVLLELNAAPGRRLRMAELGERVVLSRSRSSRVVDQLVGRGLVERVPDPGDRRAAFAQLTAAGRQALRATAPAYLASIEEHFTRHLTAAERATIAAALERVVASTPPAGPRGRRAGGRGQAAG